MRKRVKQTAAMLAAALVVSNVAVPYQDTAVVYAAEAQENESSTLSAGVYYVPVKLMSASNPANASMAASCVGSNGVLTVDETGTMKLQVTLKTLSLMGMYGNASDIKVYQSYENYDKSEKVAAEVLTTRIAKTGLASNYKEVTAAETISIALPYTDKDGVYMEMFVDAMSMTTDAYLKYDLTQAVNATELKNQMAAASQITADMYTTQTKAAFTAAYETAKALTDKEGMTQEEADQAAAALQSAIKALMLKDGVYSVPVSIYQANKDTLSMVNNGIEKTATAVVKDGKVALGLGFSQLVHYGISGYISAVSTLKDVVLSDSNVPSSYGLVPATVLSEYDVVDQYNGPDSTLTDCIGIKYPKAVQITADAADEYTWLNLYIPAMAFMGHGDQLVRLHTDYTKAVKTEEEGVTTIALNASSMTLTAGASKILTATVTGSSDNVTFTSSNEKIAKVDANGKVTAVAVGTATITAAVNGVKAECKVTVKAAPTLSLAKTAATIYTKGSTTFTVKAAVTGDTTKATFKTSNAKIATVDANGKVTAVGAGTATITVTANGISKTCKVTVKKTSLSLNKAKATIYTKGTASLQLKASVVGANNKVTYTSSNTKIAKVSSTGKVTAVKAGTVTITAKANGVTTTCKVTVKKPSITVAKSNVTVKKNKTVKIKATATPASKITYKSSNKKVATVSKSGVVKGVKKGTAKITVTSNGVSKTVKVTVK